MELRPPPAVTAIARQPKPGSFDNVVLAQSFVRYELVKLIPVKSSKTTAELLKSVHRWTSHLELKASQELRSSTEHLLCIVDITTSHRAYLYCFYEAWKTI